MATTATGSNPQAQDIRRRNVPGTQLDGQATYTPQNTTEKSKVKVSERARIHSGYFAYIHRLAHFGCWFCSRRGGGVTGPHRPAC